MVPQDAVVRNSNPFEGADAHNPTTRLLSRKFLWSTVAIILLGEAVYLSLLLTGPSEHWFRASGPVLMTLVSVAAGLLLARGKPKAALHTLIYGVWVIITLVAVINGGIRVPLVYAYPLVILTTGWMVSSRAAIIVTILTSPHHRGAGAGPVAGVVAANARRTGDAVCGVPDFANILAAMLIIFLQAYMRRLGELNTVSAGFAQRTRDLKKRGPSCTRPRP